MVREEAKALSPKQCAVIELALDTIKVHMLHMLLFSCLPLGLCLCDAICFQTLKCLLEGSRFKVYCKV